MTKFIFYNLLLFHFPQVKLKILQSYFIANKNSVHIPIQKSKTVFSKIFI